MIHYLYVGHFEHDGGFIRFANSPTDSIMKPVVRHPLDLNVTEGLLREVGGADVGISTIPEEWHIRPGDGHLVCDKYARSRDAIDFIVRLAESTGCEIADYSSQSIVRPEDLAHPRAHGIGAN